MGDERIVVGERVWTREQWFQEEAAFRKERARLPFEVKIRMLVELQKLARAFGRKTEMLVWEIEGTPPPSSEAESVEGSP